MNYKGLLAAACLALVSMSANAVPITGELGIAGQLTPTCSGGGACSMGTADGLDFGNNGAADGPFLVTFATGTFAANGITFGDVGSIADFIFNPATLPVDPLWTLSGFTFALTTLNIDSQQNNLLTLSGTGTISGNGFDVTMGDWSFSADSSNPDGGLFAWSSTTVANEPAILWLLGFGMLLVVAARRRS